MLKKYFPFYKAGAMSMMAYKFNIFSWFFISILQWVCLVFLWLSIYRSSENGINSVINGFTFKEMIVYIILINIATFTMFISDTFDQISDEIKDGTIAISFIRPISYRGRFIAQVLGTVSASFLILGLPTLTVALLAFKFLGFLSYSSLAHFFASIAFFFFAMIFAVLLNDSINFLLGTVCFYTMQAFGLNQMRQVVVGFLSGAFVPISFFPGIFGKIVDFLPFAGLAQNPILILQGKTTIFQSAQILGKNILWFAVFEFFCALSFYTASKKITVQGG